MVKPWSLTWIDAVRGGPSLSSTWKSTLPDPVRDEVDTCIHGAPLDAVHAQPLIVDTVNVPRPPSALNCIDEGLRSKVHGLASCVNVTGWLLMRTVAVREEDVDRAIFFYRVLSRPGPVMFVTEGVVRPCTTPVNPASPSCCVSGVERIRTLSPNDSGSMGRR